ncbi:hypothetical protein Tco_1054218 [Tanacetum coccineum]|uniref:Retrotransposon gag domain-containing protein n=1 Tax=Tanacetum coccineum TaxID=301880 RepID=A0ABQ5GW61_9ASTR
MVDLIHVPGVDSHQLRMKVFPLSFTDDAKQWWINEGEGKITVWEELVEKFFCKFYPDSYDGEEEMLDEGDNWGIDPLKFISRVNSSFDKHMKIDGRTKKVLIFATHQRFRVFQNLNWLSTSKGSKQEKKVVVFGAWEQKEVASITKVFAVVPELVVNAEFISKRLSNYVRSSKKRYVDAKAGQTLAGFSHSILTRFGVAFRIFEKKFSANLPSFWYVHRMKNFDALNEWVESS